MPDEAQAQLVELLTRHDIPLIEDDVYGELYFGATRPVPRPTTRRAWCCTFLILQMPGAGLPNRLGLGGPIHARARSSCRPRCRRPARRRAPSRNSWNRAATTVTCAGCATRCRPPGPDGDGGGPCVSRRHAHARKAASSCGWSCPRASTRWRCIASAGARHQRRARPDFLGQRSVRQRAALNCGHPWNEAQAEAVRTLGELALAALARPRPGARDLTLGP